MPDLVISFLNRVLDKMIMVKEVGGEGCKYVLGLEAVIYQVFCS